MIRRFLVRLLLAPAERQMLDAFNTMDQFSRHDLLATGRQYARKFPARRQRHESTASGGSI